MTLKTITKNQEIVLIFQIGSMGDTVISMPCYREIARRHPGSARYLLTNFAVGAKMVPAEAVLTGTGLIAGSVVYPMPLRGRKATIALYRKLVGLGAKTLYYLTPETKLARMVRHYYFFRICGIKNVHGVPWTRDLRFPREIKEKGVWESEASRLLRCIGAQKEPGAPRPDDRRLDLSARETATANSALLDAIGERSFIAVSVGGKVPVNNWGDGNWSALLRNLGLDYPDLGVVFVGSADERERNDRLANAWMGPVFNSCGLFSARQTAALIGRASLFVGHDTGTLHLAAAAGTRVIGIFSARNVPGKWYSDRPDDTFLYHRVDCFGCECVQVAECPHDRRCIASIDPDEVLAAAKRQLAEAAVERTSGAATSGSRAT